MTSIERAIAFTHIVARVSPAPGKGCDLRIVNTARIVSRALEADGHMASADLPACPRTETASGIPIVKRSSAQ